MIQLEKKEKCCGCSACAQICPVKCITIQADEEGFDYPVVDKSKCIQCGLCEKVCPIFSNTEVKNDSPKAYAAYHTDEAVRLQSSSGGIFTLLAEYVLRQNGVVYGAAILEKQNVGHIRVTEFEELAQLRGSKYVQSDIGETFIRAKQDLEEQKTVLFTGTPCQIEGLRSFLGKDYEKLICMDIICHGVPSPMVWQKYVDHREKAADNKVRHISFRDKRFGWRTYAVMFAFANSSEYVKVNSEDLYIKAFLSDLCLRPSCYNCGFKKVNRASDITLADFWGVEEVCPEMDDNKGTSLVIIHSPKGMAVFKAISKKLRYQAVELDQALVRNPSMVKSAKRPKKRDVFMQKIQTEPFEKVVAKYAVKRITLKSVMKAVLIKIKLWDFALKCKRRLKDGKIQ